MLKVYVNMYGGVPPLAVNTTAVVVLEFCTTVDVPLMIPVTLLITVTVNEQLLVLFEASVAV